MHCVVEKLKSFFKPNNTRNELYNNNDTAEERDAFNDQDEEGMQNIDQRQIKLNTPVNTTGILDKVRKRMYTYLCHYYPDPDPQELLSAILDPRLKSLDFVSITIKLEVEFIFKNLYDDEKASEDGQKENIRYNFKNSKIVFKEVKNY